MNKKPQRPRSRSGTLSRPESSLGQRPASRLSARTPGRQVQRLTGISETLVAQLIPNETEEARQDALNSALRTIESGKFDAPGVQIGQVDQRIRGLSEKARINIQNGLADALDIKYAQLKKHIGATSDRESTIKSSNLPDYLQFLLSVSRPATATTHRAASTILDHIRSPTPPPPPPTWASILADDPLEGQHWEGAYGLPPGSTIEGWEFQDEESSPSMSPSSSPSSFVDWRDIHVRSITEEDELAQRPSSVDTSVDDNEEEVFAAKMALDAQETVDELTHAQYWNPDWTLGVHTNRSLDLGDPSTFGPVARRVDPEYVDRGDQRYIDEVDAVREVLFILQGISSCLSCDELDEAGDFLRVSVSPSAPGIVHLSHTSFNSILTSFTTRATTLRSLRIFIQSVYTYVLSPPPHFAEGSSRPFSLALEAFASIVDTQLNEFDAWCAAKEEFICRARSGDPSSSNEIPGLIVSLLSLHRDVAEYMGDTFDILAAIAAQHPPSVRSQARIQSTSLLNALITAIQSLLSRKGRGAGATPLLRTFTATAEPLWTHVGNWLKLGMDMTPNSGFDVNADNNKLGDEFFVKRDADVPPGASEFWAEEYTLQDGDVDDSQSHSGHGLEGVPLFLQPVAQEILAAGKAVGLLRALEVDEFFGEAGNDDETDADTGQSGSGYVEEYEWLKDWTTFRTLVVEQGGFDGLGISPSNSSSPSSVPLPSDELVSDASLTSSSPSSLYGDEHDDPEESSMLSIDALSSLVQDYLEPYCRLAQSRLNRVIVVDCELWLHLNSMEDLYFMRRGDVLTDFCDVLFARINEKKPWSDYHFLNSIFRDVAESSAYRWIDESLVRLSYRGLSQRNVLTSVKVLNGLSIEYQVPFPLTYLFGSSSTHIYSSVFVFLLQLRRVRSVIEGILLRETLRMPSGELKAFHALRSKFSWFINTLMYFILTNVLHEEIATLHEGLESARSLDEMIKLHGTHLVRVQRRCLLHPETSSLHRAILTILDIGLHFGDISTSYVEENVYTGVETPKVMLKGRRRRRRLNRQQRLRKTNLIGFTDVMPTSEDDDDEDDDDEDNEGFDEFGQDQDGFDGSQTPNSVDTFNMTSISFADESFASRVDKITIELDVLVRSVSRGVERLGSGGSEAAPTFAILAFALESWDL